MQTSELDLNLLVALRALLIEANVTKAGQSVNMGQSSMSAALARLRQHFNDELLVRVGRDYELTPLGQLLLDQIQLALPAVEKSFGEATFEPARLHRTFRVMASDFAGLELKPGFAAALQQAPDVSIELLPLPSTPTDSERDLINNDFVVALPGIGIEGSSTLLFVDHYVCLVDPGNSALVDGRLSWQAFTDLPQAVAHFGRAHVTPAERRLRELGFKPSPTVATAGFLPLPSIVAGTQLVAVVPHRLATRLGPITGTVGVPAPFGRVEILETLWWHSTYDGDPAHAWFRSILTGEAAAPTAQPSFS